MRRCLDELYRLNGWLAAASVAGICCLVCAQVGLNLADALSSALVGRSLGLSIPSYAELAGFLLAAASFLALASTWRSRGHIRVTLVLDRLGGRHAYWLGIWALAIAITITAFLARHTCGLAMESWRFGDVSPGLVAVPLWLPQSVMAWGLLVLTVAQVDDLIGQLGIARTEAGSSTEPLVASPTVRRAVRRMTKPRMAGLQDASLQPEGPE